MSLHTLAQIFQAAGEVVLGTAIHTSTKAFIISLLLVAASDPLSFIRPSSPHSPASRAKVGFIPETWGPLSRHPWMSRLEAEDEGEGRHLGRKSMTLPDEDSGLPGCSPHPSL